MKIKKILTLFVIIIIVFSACNKKRDKESIKSQTTKIQKRIDKKMLNSLKIKKSVVSQKQVEKLSDIFKYGDKLLQEKKEYQKKIYEFSKNFKNIKNPLTIKKEGKYKYTKVTYFSNSVWTAIYPTKKMIERHKLFWIIVSYKDHLNELGKKAYNKRFGGYPVKHLKNKWVWVILKNNIEIKITANKKSVQNDKMIEEVLKEFDIKAIESIFDENTKYPELKEYFLKIKELNSKIMRISKKFKEKEVEAISTIKPFIINDKGVLNGLDLSRIYFINNTFSISVKKNKKLLLSIHIGKADALGLLSYFNNKNLVHDKIGKFSITVLKDNIAIVRLPYLAVKVATYFKNEFKDSSKLLEIAFAMDLDGLSKVK